MTEFSEEQIRAIERIVDSRIMAQSTKQTATASRNYHSVTDIRRLILDHYGALKDQLGDDDFDIVILRHCLSKQTTLLPGDSALIGGQRRWDHQVCNAIRLPDWPQCPIVPGAKRRSYRFADNHQPNLSLLSPHD